MKLIKTKKSSNEFLAVLLVSSSYVISTPACAYLANIDGR